MSMSAVNLPLVALFGVAYGMGHPEMAPYRPEVADKTLASFHQDINRTARDLNQSIINLVAARSAFASVSTVQQPVALASSQTISVSAARIRSEAKAAAAGQSDAPRRGLVEPLRVQAKGFTELKAR